MSTNVVREDMGAIAVFWVIDNETDTIVGSTHTHKTAKALASDHEATTQHVSRIHRVMMTEDHANDDGRAT